MFKEYVAEDINTFVDPDEFGEKAKLNGVTVNIVPDKEQMDYKIKKDYDGLIIGDILFFISAEEYKKIPRMSRPASAGDALMFNGKPATVVSCNEMSGMYEMILKFAG